MESNRKLFIINVELIIMLVLCVAMSVVLIALLKSNTIVQTISKTGDKLENSYATTEEMTYTNRNIPIYIRK